MAYGEVATGAGGTMREPMGRPVAGLVCCAGVAATAAGGRPTTGAVGAVEAIAGRGAATAPTGGRATTGPEGAREAMAGCETI